MIPAAEISSLWRCVSQPPLSLDGLCGGRWGGVSVMDTVVGGKGGLRRGLYLFFGFWFRVWILAVRIEKN